MKTKFELSDLQVEMILAWKEKHLGECLNTKHKFKVTFSDEDEICTNIKCLKCDQSKDICDWGEYEPTKSLKVKTFEEEIFLGAGSYSILQCDKLHVRLNYAISMLGGQQQNGGMGTEYRVEEEKETELAIIEVIEDVIVALGMKDKFKLAEIEKCQD